MVIVILGSPQAQDDYMSICHIILVTVNHLFLSLYKPSVADVPGVGPVPLRAAPPHPRVPAEHRLPLPRDALPAAWAHRNGENVQYRVELQTNLREDFTITEKAPTWAFSWLEALTSTFTYKTLLNML